MKDETTGIIYPTMKSKDYRAMIVKTCENCEKQFLRGSYSRRIFCHICAPLKPSTDTIQ